MTRLARTGCLLAFLGAAAGAVLWWLSGAWQQGGMPTGGMVRIVLFALAAVACHAVAAVLRRRVS